MASAQPKRSPKVPDSSRAGLQRLLSGLDSLRDEVDVVVMDAGSGVTPWTQRFWLRAQLVVLVTTTDDAAIMDAYAAVKQSAAEGIRPALRLLINQAENDRVADDVCRRAQQACRRFLSVPLEALPPLPADENGAGTFGSLRVWESPHSPFSRAMLWVGQGVRDFMRPDSTGACDREHSPENNSQLVSNVR